MKLKQVKVLDGFDGGCSLRVSRAGNVMVACGVTSRAWDTATWAVRSEIDEVDDGDKPVRACDLTSDGGLLAVGGLHMTTKVFDTQTGRRVALLSKPKKDIHTAADHVAFSPDSGELACARSSKLEVFRAGDWQPAREHPLHRPQIADMAYTPDGKWLATASGKSVIFWSTADPQQKVELTGHKKMVQSLAIAADGTFAATAAEDGVVMLWELPAGRKYAEYTGHGNKVFRVILSPDGTTAASFDYDNEFHLWDTSARRQLGKVRGGDYEKMTFSPDGRLLVIPHASQNLRIVGARDGQTLAEVERGGSVAFVGGRMAVSQGSKVLLWKMDT